jgi:hypothetical protein
MLLLLSCLVVYCCSMVGVLLWFCVVVDDGCVGVRGGLRRAGAMKQYAGWYGGSQGLYSGWEQLLLHVGMALGGYFAGNGKGISQANADGMS